MYLGFFPFAIITELGSPLGIGRFVIHVWMRYKENPDAAGRALQALKPDRTEIESRLPLWKLQGFGQTP